MLINADRFIMISGQRGYFYEQKEFLSLEIERLNNLYKKNYYKKREWKKKYNDSHSKLSSSRYTCIGAGFHNQNEFIKN